MFTGIVQGVAELVAIEESASFRTHVIRMPSREWGEGLALTISKKCSYNANSALISSLHLLLFLHHLCFDFLFVPLSI